MEDTLPKDREGLIQLARAQGWSVSKTAKGHIRFESPLKKYAFASGTPSDWRSDKNLRAQLRKAGLKMAAELPVEEPKPLRTPQIVIDKAALAAPREEVVVATRADAPPGAAREAILWAMSRVPRGGGVTAEDILTHVQAKLPDQDLKKVGANLLYMAKTGRLVKDGMRYTVAPEGHKVPKRTYGPRKGKAVAAPPVMAMPDPADAAVLEEVMGSLAKLKGLIEKYQSIGNTINGLQNMLAAFGGKSG